jgi:Fe-S-cluster-containing dehydrogenase component
MSLTRRQLLCGAAAGAATTFTPMAARAEQTVASAGALGLLYDATVCIGCQACVSACVDANSKPQDMSLAEARSSERGLTIQARSTVKLYTAPDASERSFVKLQCMHCVDPACVASCMFGALHKDSRTGIVRWDASRCVGCRYCEIACAFHVPRFEWQAFNPRIVKCELCGPRLAEGREPACTSVCPTHAVVFGQRKSLLTTAHQRIAAHPGQYSEDRVYGEHDAGGTQALYLAHIAYNRLGLPQLGTESISAKYLKWQKRIYAYLAAPAAAYVLLAGVLGKRWRTHQIHEEEEEESTGLKPQL